MKTLFIGGVKSGKSKLAEAYILESAKTKPYYLATAEMIDEEIRQRIAQHQLQREDRFITIEESIHLSQALENCPGPVLIECLTLWLNNMVFHHYDEKQIFQEINTLLQLPIDLVFVLNEVGFGIIPDNPLARQFVDLSGRTAQRLGAECDRVYFCSAGLKLVLK